jgi:hypothetical protein
MLSYLRRHWRGELSLGVAWWVNGVGVTALTAVLELYGVALATDSWVNTRGGFTVFIAAGVILLLLVPAWQVIGIFRAADRHAEEAGAFIAARLTQSLATLLTIALAMRFLVFAGEMASAARIAYGLAGGYTVAATHDGSVIEVSGAINFGLAEDVGRALDANPGARRVRLNSGGGSLSEAQKLRALILARGLDTDSTTECSSACLSAYIAGRHRLLHRSAHLGFHLPRNPGFGLRGPVTPQYARELAYFGSRGVPLWFRERWVGTGRRFWYPTPSQLRAARIVHEFFGTPRPGEEIYYR